MARVRAAAGGLVALVVVAVALVGPPAAGAGPGYAIYQTQYRSSEPVRWNPCAPITFRINANGLANAAAVRRVRDAVAEAAAASGIEFRYVGTTGFVPDSRWHPVPRSVGADVVITWARPGRGARRSALLSYEPRLAGVGGFAPQISDRGFEVARSGFVIFDAARIFSMSVRKQYVVALHELGHLLGLDDFADRQDVMNPVVLDRGPRHYGPGDRAGLHRLGRAAGCLAAAPAPRRPTVQRAGNALHIATPSVTSVSGAVVYGLSSPELGGRIATANAPSFVLPLAALARTGHAGEEIHFQVSAANRVGTTASQAQAYQVPSAVLTSEPSLVVTPTTFDVVAPHAVLAGTTVDVSDELAVGSSGTLDVFRLDGTSFGMDFDQHIVMYGLTITKYQVSGTVTVSGLGLNRTFDLTGSYLTSAVTSVP